MRHWLAVGLLVLAAAPGALGAPKPTGPRPLAALVNVARGPTEQEAGDVLAGYKALARGLPGWDLLPDLVARRLLAGSVRDWPIEEARRLLDRGRLAQAALKLEEALSLLERAEDLLLAKVPTEKARPVLKLVWASLVAAHHAAGQIEAARKAAGRLALVSPTGAPLPPSLWNRYRPGTQAFTPPAVLRIRAPEAARVWVDFRPSAPSRDATAPPQPGEAAKWKLWEVPVERPTVLVAVEAPGHARFFESVALRPGETKEIVPILRPTETNPHAKLAAWWFERLRRGVGPKELQELGWRLHLDLLVVTDTSAQSRTYRLFHVKSGIFQGTVASLDPKALAAWKALRLVRQRVSPARKAARAAARNARPAPAGSTPKQKEATPLWKKWYFWVIIGAVVAGATAFALTRQDEGRDEVEIRVWRP